MNMFCQFIKNLLSQEIILPVASAILSSYLTVYFTNYKEKQKQEEKEKQVINILKNILVLLRNEVLNEKENIYKLLNGYNEITGQIVYTSKLTELINSNILERIGGDELNNFMYNHSIENNKFLIELPYLLNGIKSVNSEYIFNEVEKINLLIKKKYFLNSQANGTQKLIDELIVKIDDFTLQLDKLDL